MINIPWSTDPLIKCLMINSCYDQKAFDKQAGGVQVKQYSDDFLACLVRIYLKRHMLVPAPPPPNQLLCHWSHRCMGGNSFSKSSGCIPNFESGAYDQQQVLLIELEYFQSLDQLRGLKVWSRGGGRGSICDSLWQGEGGWQIHVTSHFPFFSHDHSLRFMILSCIIQI